MFGFKLAVEMNALFVGPGQTGGYVHYYVSAEDADGKRWAHFRKFGKDDGLTTKQALVAAEKLRHAITLSLIDNDGWKVRPSSSPHWAPMSPAPGSFAAECEEMEPDDDYYAAERAALYGAEASLT